MSKTRKKKSTRSRRKTVPRQHSWRRKLFLILGLIGLLVLLFMAGYLWYLNDLVKQRFTGHIWDMPSRVYARPLELIVGMPLNQDMVLDELKLAGYHSRQSLQQPGDYRVKQGRVELYHRSFQFADHHQAASRISLELSAGVLSGIRNLDSGESLGFFQLSPAQIGSFRPRNGEDRWVITREQIPPRLIDILLAVEDRQFYDHAGIRPLSIIRALWANLRAGRTVQGGSTLTQQLAKNLFLSRDRTLVRKLREALLALLLERHMSKDDILHAYINEVYLLQHKQFAIHGFALAGKLLFDQPLQHLNDRQLALLVGMIKGPGIYHPVLYPERAAERRNQVLNVLYQQELISLADYESWSKQAPAVNQHLPPVNPYPAYLDLVKKQLQHQYSNDVLKSQGLSIFTSFDPALQRTLEQGIQRGLSRFQAPALQAAAVMADYLSGDVQALVGDRTVDYPGFNRAISTQRPIGSLLKPLILYGLLESGYSLASTVDDRHIQVRLSDGTLWEPRNYDLRERGLVTLYKALTHSYNLPFIHAGLAGDGLSALAHNLQRIGLQKQAVIYPSLLLGATQMSPFEVAQMYQVIAAEGFFTPLSTIREVLGPDQQLILRVPLESVKLFDQGRMIQVKRALLGATTEGTARYLSERYPQVRLAGKTGTTNDLRDSWFAGFDDRLLTVVWLGHDDNRPTALSGSAGALRVWADIHDPLEKKSVKLSTVPELQWMNIDPADGLILPQGCDRGIQLPIQAANQLNRKALCY